MLPRNISFLVTPLKKYTKKGRIKYLPFKYIN